MSGRPNEGDYSRIYHSIVDDDRFATVMDDCEAGWTWVRLLIIAEQAWPVSAYLPRWVRRRPLRVLADAGIVEVDGDKFRIHGLDPERQARADHARDAAVKRWDSRSNAHRTAASNAPSIPPGNAQSMLDETSIDETSTPRARPREASTADVEGPFAWLASHGAGIDPGSRLFLRLVDLTHRHGSERVIATLEALPGAATGRQYVLGAENTLDAIPRPDARAERTKEAEAASARRIARTQAYIAELKGTEA